MNETRVVELYVKTLHVADAEIFLRTTDKEIWTALREELRGTTKAERVKLWDDCLDLKVATAYKQRPNAFLIPKYRGKSTYAEDWRRRKIKAKFRFVNCFRVPKKEKLEKSKPMVAPDHSTVQIRIFKEGHGGALDESGILFGLENLYSRVSLETMDRLVARARMKAMKRKAA